MNVTPKPRQVTNFPIFHDWIISKTSNMADLSNMFASAACVIPHRTYDNIRPGKKNDSIHMNISLPGVSDVVIDLVHDRLERLVSFVDQGVYSTSLDRSVGKIDFEGQEVIATTLAVTLVRR